MDFDKINTLLQVCERCFPLENRWIGTESYQIAHKSRIKAMDEIARLLKVDDQLNEKLRKLGIDPLYAGEVILEETDGL